MESSGAWGNRARPGARASYPAANPFADAENDNPFNAPSHPPEQVVETILQQHASWSTFGTPPPSMASSPQGLHEVPLQQQATGQANSSGSKPQPRRMLSFQPQTPPDPNALTSSSFRNAKKDSGASRASSDKTLSAFNIASQPPKQTLSQPSLKGLGPALPLSSYPSTGQADIDRRTEELRRWEADLSSRETLLRQQAGSSKNWPRCLPILHHDIAADIPFERKGLVRSGYIAWCIVAAGYLWNFVSLTAFFIAGQKKVSLWVMAGLVAIAGLPLSFLCWYRGLYFAASRDSAGRWLFYMLNMLVHIVWCWWMFVGINPDIGGYSAGLFTMISQFKDGGGRGVTFGIMCIINMVLFAISGSLSMIVYIRSWVVFRRGSPLPVDRVVIRIFLVALRIKTLTKNTMAAERFRNFDFEADERWNRYALALTFPPGREDLVVRYKARWFKREIDPNLDIDDVAPPPSSKKEAEQTASGAPSGPSVNRGGGEGVQARSTNSQPSAESSTTTRRDQTENTTQNAQEGRSQQRPATVSLVIGIALVLGHAVLILSCLAIIQPFNIVVSHIGQTYFVRASLLVHGVRLFRKVGRPSSFTSFAALRPWIQKVSATTEAFYLMTTILLASNPSAWMGFLPMAILAMYHVSSGLSSIMVVGRGALIWKRVGGESLHRWLAVHQQDALQIMAMMEVGAGFQLGLSALRVGPRALMTTWVYVNQLRLRYWSPESRAYHVKAWQKLGAFVDPVLRNFPISQRIIAAGKRWFEAAGRR